MKRRIGKCGCIQGMKPYWWSLFMLPLESWSPPSFLLLVIWNPWVSSEVSFFAWEACREKASTLDQLQKSGWKLVNRCFLCKAKEKSTDLILPHCPKTKGSLAIVVFFGHYSLGFVNHSERDSIRIAWVL